MASHEKQLGGDIPFDVGNPLFDELLDIADQENMTVFRLREILNKCLTLGIEGRTPEEVIHAREQLSKFIEIVEHKEIAAERKTLQKEGKLIDLEKRLNPSDSKVPYGKLATVTPLFNKEKEVAIVELAVIAKSVEKPRNHLRLIK